MAKFQVEVTKSYYLVYTVDADDKEDAERIVNDFLLGEEVDPDKIEEDALNGMHTELTFEPVKEI
jgi:hypothetical protein